MSQTSMIRLMPKAAVLTLAMASPALTAEICQGFGPQTPRDISLRGGTNDRVFSLAPPATSLNLCNIHTHTNAEHRGPGFRIFAGPGPQGGYRCNETATLTEAELAPAPVEHGMEGVKPGDTIEVHWVFTSCDVAPGPGLGSCMSPACANPQLRVEAQAFLVVNDPAALDFEDYGYHGAVNPHDADLPGRPAQDSQHDAPVEATPRTNVLRQPAALPTGTGTPVVFAGSTTGPSFDQTQCSPLQVTWSVRPQCAKLDINSLHRWAAHGNVFDEHHSHGVRQLVTSADLLAPIAATAPAGH